VENAAKRKSSTLALGKKWAKFVIQYRCKSIFGLPGRLQLSMVIMEIYCNKSVEDISRQLIFTTGDHLKVI
jgi:hypothetical protein